jgi:hypothetical protein
MACEKLAEGIRLFVKDLHALRTLIQAILARQGGIERDANRTGTTEPWRGLVALHATIFQAA